MNYVILPLLNLTSIFMAPSFLLTLFHNHHDPLLTPFWTKSHNGWTPKKKYGLPPHPTAPALPLKLVKRAPGATERHLVTFAIRVSAEWRVENRVTEAEGSCRCLVRSRDICVCVVQLESALLWARGRKSTVALRLVSILYNYVSSFVLKDSVIFFKSWFWFKLM